MSPNFWGCRCCKKPIRYVTHRLFSNAGDHIWSKLHSTSAVGTFDGGPQAIAGVMLGADNEVVTSTYTNGLTNKFQSLKWTIPGGVKTEVSIDVEFNGDWPDHHWHTDNDGGMYKSNDIMGSRFIFRSPIETKIWHYDPVAVHAPDPTHGNYSVTSRTLNDAMHDGSRVASCYIETHPQGATDHAGVISVNSDGTLGFQEGYRWTEYPPSHPVTPAYNPYIPDFAEFDSDGKLYAFFEDPVFEHPDYSVFGTVWVFDTDGTLLTVHNPAVTPVADKKRQNIFQNLYLFTGSSTTIRRHLLSDFSVDLSFDASSYGAGVTQLKCDQVGMVYALIDNEILLAFDVDLNLLWEFHENGSSGFNSNCGLQCNDGYVAVGGAIKEEIFEPSQLIVYP